MFESLYAKTFIILGVQLFITWAVTVIVIQQVRRLYYAGTVGVTASTNEEGILDLDLDWELIKPYFYGLLALDIVVFLLLLFKGQQNLILGIPLFSIWSILTGIELALVLISVDENLGAIILALTATITIGCALVGIFSGIDFGFMGVFLFVSLILLIAANLIRLFIAIPGAKQRIIAFFGVLVFTGYLLYDFNRLAKMNESIDANTWNNAMNLSISIYLDIINLFLNLLDLLS